ncbi:glycoside hydrolase family 9 protein [Acetivibrio cellulolyticus]|nr:glycoside hydrolase family 9 protein [Acetivibrio cellulolyticus]
MKKGSKIRKVQAVFLAICIFGTLFTAPAYSETTTTDATTVNDYNFAKALQMSLYFYDAEKCGRGITDGRLEWRGDCHLEDEAVPLIPMESKESPGTNMSQAFIDKYREFLDPDNNGTLDQGGGMHDAGDHVKFGLPQGYAASTLEWGFYEFRQAFIDKGLEDHMIEILRWFTDYFLKSTYMDADGNVIAFCYQVGNGDVDHSYWGPPELQQQVRPAFFATSENPAADQCANVSAALSISYLNFKDSDKEYAEKCLTTAKALYEFAKKYRGTGYSGGYYGSAYDDDEMSWAAVWLNIATGNKQYIDDIVSVKDGKYTGYMKKIIVNEQNHWQNIWVHSWDVVWGGVFAKLAPITNTDRDWYIFRWNNEYWASIQHENASDTAYLKPSPAGFKVVNTWGSARYNCAAQLCCLVYRKYTGREDFSEWAKGQMEYIMGNNPLNRCYIVGYAENSAKHPHHRAAHGSKTNSMEVPTEHRHTLWGALVGGPDAEDVHEDITTDYVYNEVAIDYNAGFVGALAGLCTYFGQDQEILKDFPPKEDPVDVYYTEAMLEQENKERTQVTIKLYNESVHPPHREGDMKVRYYFDIDEMLDAGQTVDDVELQIMYDENDSSYGGPIKYSGPFKWDDTGVYYVEFDWSDYEVYGTRNIQFALIGAQDSNYKFHWDPTNDWSRQGITEEFVKSKYIPVYNNGELVFGSEPPKGVATPTATPDPNATPTPQEKPSLKVMYKYGYADDGIEGVGDVKGIIKVLNNGKKPVDLSTVSIRYWYTKDSNSSQDYVFDYIKVDAEKVEGNFVEISKPVDTADSYFDISFKDGAGVIGPGSDSGEIQFRISQQGLPYSLSNDYSFNADAEGYIENSKITVYVNSELVYGIEPDGVTTPTPTPAQYVYGDVNGDGSLNSIDFGVMRKYLLGMIKEFSYENGLKAGDVDGNGMFNSLDFAYMRQYMLGIISKFPVQK